jgi:uncharacterized protein (TIGR03083 family)
VDYRSEIALLSEHIARLAQANELDLPVPSCPEWTLGDLVFHIGSVHATWAKIIEEASPNTHHQHPVDDVTDDLLVVWFKNHTKALLKSMAEAVPEARCWTWWGEPRTVLAVERHQVQEAAIHLWDVQNSLGAAPALDRDIARDGVAEFLLVQREFMTLPTDARISLVANDAPESWFVGAPGAHDVALTGSSSDVVLVLHGRLAMSALDVVGDVGIAHEWLSSFDLS